MWGFMDSRVFQSLISSSAHWSIHKIILNAMPNWNTAGILSELAEQNNMSDTRGTTNDGWFPLNYATISKRLKIPHNTVRTIMTYLLEKDLYSTKRQGVPPKTYYKLNTTTFQSLFKDTLGELIISEPVVAQTSDSSSFKRSGTSSYIKLKERRTKEQGSDDPGSDEPQAVRPILIKRKQILQKQVVKSTFNNENIAEIFRYFCGKTILPSHKVDPDSRTFQDCQKSITKALRKYKIDEIKQAIDNYCLILEDPGFYPSTRWHKESLPLFFLFNERTGQRYQNNTAKWANNVDSWFDECVMGLPYLIKKFGNGLHDIDPYPNVTAALIKQFNKKQETIMGGTNSNPTDDKYFVNAAKIVVEFYEKHKNKINWGGNARASRNVVFFAPMMIDARFHFSQDDVSMVKPTWFSSDRAILFLVDYLTIKGMVDKSNKRRILNVKTVRRVTNG